MTRGNSAGVLIMNKKEISVILRTEVGELEGLIKKLQFRCDRLKSFLSDLEAEIAGPSAQNQVPVPDSKFRKAIDKVFGEKPKLPKR